MADHVYKIVIDFKGDQQQQIEQNPNAVFAEFPEIEPKASKDNPFNALNTGLYSFASVKPMALMAASMAKNIYSHEIQRVGRYTGSQQAQDVANAATSILGAIANPIGTMINLAYQYDQFYYERQWESIGLSLSRERAGVSFNRSRTET